MKVYVLSLSERLVEFWVLEILLLIGVASSLPIFLAEEVEGALRLSLFFLNEIKN